MVKTIFSASALNVISKAFGFIFILLLTYNNTNSDELGYYILYWSYAIYIQSALLAPIVHYKSAVDNSTECSYKIPYVLIPLIMCFMVSKEMQPAALLLSMFLLTFECDLYLIRSERYLLIPILNSLKNLFAIIAIVIDCDYYCIFILYAIGELTKFIIVVLLSRRLQFSYTINVNTELINNSKNLLLYIIYLTIGGSYLIIIKSVLVDISSQAVVQLELLLRLVDVILIAITTGVMPIFLREYNKRNLKTVNKIILISNVMVIIGVLGGLAVSYLLFSYTSCFDIPEFISNNQVIYFLMCSLLTIVLVNLSFYRKIFGFTVSVKQLISILLIVLTSAMLFLSYKFSFIGSIMPVVFSLFVYVFGLSLEFLYIKNQIKKHG